MNGFKHSLLAVLLLAAAALSAPAGADFKAGLEAYQRGDYRASFGQWKPLAEAGNAPAQYNLGILYENGLGVAKNAVKAYRWYQKAARQDYGPAVRVVARFRRDRPKTVRKAESLQGRSQVEDRQRAELKRLKEQRLRAKKRAEESRRQKAPRPRRQPAPAAGLSVPVPTGWVRGAAGRFMSAEPGDTEDLLGINAHMTLYTPRGETPETWSEMILVETIRRPAAGSGKLYSGFIVNVEAGCALGEGAEAGGPGAGDPGTARGTIRVFYACTKLKAQEYGLYAEMKAVRGTESLYAVRRVWRGKPFPKDAIAKVRERFGGWDAWFGRIGTGPGEGADKVSRGFGFYVSPKGHILTTHAVVKGCKWLRFSSAKAKLLVSDPVKGLALFQVRKKPPHVATFPEGGGVREGDPVVVAGNPPDGQTGSDLAVSTGVVKAIPGAGADGRFVSVTAPIQPGSSGAPLLDLTGAVAGVVMAKPEAARLAGLAGEIPEKIELALGTAIIKEFLSGQGVPFETAAPGKVLAPSDAGDKARSFTVSVECRK